METATVRPAGGEWRSRLAEALSPQELAEVSETIDSAKRLLSPDAMMSLQDINDFDAASKALRTAWNAVSRALAGDDEAAEAIVSSEDLIELLFRVHNAEDIVRRIESRQKKEKIRTVRDALTQFQGARQIKQLNDKCPKVLAGLGFDRAMLSMVNGSTWVPASAYIDGDPDWARTIVQSGQQYPQELLSALPETEIVRRRKCILVQDAQDNPNVNKAIIQPALARSYVASGLMSEGKVIGFLHCDQYFHPGEMLESDRELLDLFGQGFGYILERAILASRVAVIADQLGKLPGDISSIVQGPDGGAPIKGNASSSPSLSRMAETPLVLDPAADAYDLTRREMEVLRMMAAGETNSQISSELVISEGTVKSHVKHVFRKLGVTSRAEAVSCWFSMQRTS